MQIPLQITFRGMSHSDALETHVRRRADKLDHLFGRLVACHVVIEVANKHHRHGCRYRVSINMTVPGAELAVSHAPAEDRYLDDAHATVEEGFDEAERRLEEWARRRRERRHEVAR